MTVHKLERGLPYPIPVPEGVRLSIESSGATLLLGYEHATAEEIRAARNGVAQLVLIPLGLSVVLAYRLGTQPWSDAPYAIGRLADDKRNELLASEWLAGDVPDGIGLALQIVLVSTGDNLVRALRVVALSTTQTRRLAGVLRDQADAGWSPMAEHAEQEALYAVWPSDRLREHPDAIA